MICLRHSTSMAVVGSAERTIPTDHWQFFVEGRSSKGGDWDITGIYNDMKTGRAVPTPVGLAVATARLWGRTRVAVEVHDSEPVIDRSAWDEVTLLRLQVLGGSLYVYAPEMTGTDEVWRYELPDGDYDCAVLAAGFESVTDEINGIGDDHYRILLWRVEAGQT